MEEIKVGEYVRTNEGDIRKIDKIERCPICKENIYINKEIIKRLKFTNTYHKEDITNYSFNIIDLIEAGDVINYYSNYSGNEIKMEVDYVCCKKDDYKWGLGYVSTHYDDYAYIEDIKSIVTKEHFKVMEYKV